MGEENEREASWVGGKSGVILVESLQKICPDREAAGVCGGRSYTCLLDEWEIAIVGDRNRLGKLEVCLVLADFVRGFGS